MLQDIQKTLWATADKLRANMDAAEYKHLVLGLIFVKYISDTFAAHHAEASARFSQPHNEFYYCNTAAEDLAVELEDRRHYTSGNVFWAVVPPGSSLLRAFDEIVSVLGARRAHNLELARSLAAALYSLLPRLISGQLKLPDLDVRARDKVAV